MCPKVAHMTKASAQRHADSLESTYGERPNVYQCNECHGVYHVGYSGEKRKNMKKRSRRNYRARRGVR